MTCLKPYLCQHLNLTTFVITRIFLIPSSFNHGACVCTMESLYHLYSYLKISRVREEETARRLSNRLFHVRLTLMFKYL